jgi:hypothetical protein
MILRFDCRTINDLVTYRAGLDMREHIIIAACNDGYSRVFSTSGQTVQKAIKGVSGNPLCLNLAGRAKDRDGKFEPRDLLAIGYEDDTFIVYSILQDFEPLIRGRGHRSFISAIKFDNFYIDKQLEMQAKEA